MAISPVVLGYVATPVILALRSGGIFTELEPVGGTVEELASRTGIKPGPLGIALRLLERLHCVEQSAGRYHAGRHFEKCRLVPQELAKIYRSDNCDLLEESGDDRISPWLDQLRNQWGAMEPEFAAYLNGVLALPAVAGIATKCRSRGIEPESFIAGLQGRAVYDLLQNLDYMSRDGSRLVTMGRAMFAASPIFEQYFAYREMLDSMSEILSGKVSSVSAPCGTLVHEPELHERFDQAVAAAVAGTTGMAKPRFILDSACGDGALLRRALDIVRSSNASASSDNEQLPTLIGIDREQALIDAAGVRLAGTKHHLLVAEGEDPAGVVALCAQFGASSQDILQIRSYAARPRRIESLAAVQTDDRGRTVSYGGAYSDTSGGVRKSEDIVRGIAEEYRSRAKTVGEHGLIQIDAHCLPTFAALQDVRACMNPAADALRSFAGQVTVESDAMLLAAAGAGLFPRIDTFFKSPPASGLCDISLNHFERRPYLIRLACEQDMLALRRLEEECWAPPMQLADAELLRRMDVYPEGQLVVEHEGRVVGVIYSQRIDDVSEIARTTFAGLSKLRRDLGPVVQLLSVNVLPEMQQFELGYQLLDFVLLRSTVQNGVREVAAVTRCRDFAGEKLSDLAEYVQERDSRGRPADAVLQFHHSHGAEICGVLEGFRPEDAANLGAGVLVRYELGNQGVIRKAGASGADAPSPSSGSHDERFEALLRELLGPVRVGNFSWNRSLRDMGLESLDLLELRRLLQLEFGLRLSPTFFFAYPRPADIVSFLASGNRERTKAPRVRSSVDLGLPDSSAAGLDARRANVSVPTGDSEPIAVIGMAGRFPGAENLSEYWNLLDSGRSGISVVPRDRFDIERYFSDDPDEAGRIGTRFGGFIGRADRFDAAFFGISPTEAALMDPQQRYLLEAHWDALEDAGIDPARLSETDSAFYVGVYLHDYEMLQASAGCNDIGPLHATGSSSSVTAGRLAYFFGTHGPAVSIDTACSSSLVAVHHAMRSLRANESRLALASGVNLILSPRMSIAFSQAKMLSPDGKCKTFDESADGYVRSEGCGVVVLKRLRDALADGDTVLAILRGSAINQDGASNGLTAPSISAQADLIRRALDDAALTPQDIDYIEAHGTGTNLGDPVEFQALADTFAGRDTGRPLWVGSVKTNIGHAEAAAGIAGLIKVVMSMENHRLPAHLHLKSVNSQIDLASVPARIPIDGMPWRREGGVLRAGVSSFGFSGTNAHVVVEEGPRPARDETQTRSGHLLALSARTPNALADRVRATVDWLSANPDTDLNLLSWRINRGRHHFDCRVAAAGADAASISAALKAALARFGAAAPGRKPRIAFLFTGQGSQYPGMARELAAHEPSFRAALRECRDLLSGELTQSLDELLYPADDTSHALDQTANTQPALFSIEYALARMLINWGVEPVAVLGHSVGEYVAACIAGVFSLEDGLSLISARGRLMQALPEGGAMCAVLGPAARTLAALEGRNGVSVGAFNGPSNTVLSGSRDVVTAIGSELEASGMRVVPLAVSHAFHSHLMEPILEDFRNVAAKVRFTSPRLEFASNVSGNLADGEIASAEYWVRHIREPVRFEAGVRALAARDIDLMLEIGPHPVLSGMASEVLGDESSGVPLCIPTLNREEPDFLAVFGAASVLYEQGVDLNWDEIGRPRSPGPLHLPTYPWQRKSHWFRELAGESREVRDQEGVAREGGSCLYELRWVDDADRPRERVQEVSMPWVVLDDNEALGAELVRLAVAAKIDCERVAGVSALAHARHGKLIDLRALHARTGSAPGTDEAAVARKLGLQFIELLRSAQSAGACSCVLVTRGAWPPEAGAAGNPAHASLAALANVARTELPELDIRVIDLADESAKDAAASLFEELMFEDDAPRVRRAAGRRYLPRLERRSSSPGRARLRGDGSYLIAGGLGGLGLATAKWMVDRGAREIVLIGRSRPPSRGQWTSMVDDEEWGPRVRQLMDIEVSGARLILKQADILLAEDCSRLKADLKREGVAPVRGIVQASAVLSGQLISDVDDSEFGRVLAPKSLGTLNLLDAFAADKLDFVLLYSSVGALFGLPGQASYAAANAFMDGIAGVERLRGVPCTSINWCGWRNTGVASTREGRHALDELAMLGIESLDAASATDVLDEAVDSEVSQLIVLPQSRSFSTQNSKMGSDPLLAGLTPSRSGVQALEPPSLATELVALEPRVRRRRLESLVIAVIAALLDLDESGIDPDCSLGDLGIGSLLGLEFRKQLQRRCGIALAPTVIWSFPTARAIAAHLESRLISAESSAKAPVLSGNDRGSASAVGRADIEALSDEEALRQLTERV